MSPKDPFNTTGKLFSRPEERKTLHPLFGSFCLTQSFTIERNGYQERIHLEAYQDDPVRKTWTVSRVIERVERHKTIKTKSEVLKAKQSFTEAAARLAIIEQELRTHPDYTPMFPEPEHLGFRHFKAFAEREGYVFDVSGLPHAKPALLALPPDAEFNQKDIDSANKHIERPASEFDNAGPASKAPSTHFLFDHFTLAARHSNIKQGMNELRILDVLDRFVKHIENCNKHFNTFCASVAQNSYYADVLDDADDTLKMAEFNLRQLKVYGVETAVFDSFLLQCRITCHVLHAQGLYQLMHDGHLNLSANQAVMDHHVNEAVALFRRIDNSDKAVKQLQDMIVQGGLPGVPASIQQFVANYNQQRTAYLQQNDKKPGTPPPSAP